jgi:hypothetical protein
MMFRIDNFVVSTDKKLEKLNEQVLVPYSLTNGKPSDYRREHKFREFTIFNGLNFLEKKDGKYYRVISDLFNFIDLIELLKAFNGNKLNTEKTYQIGTSFTAKTAQKDGNMSLSIHFTNYSYKLYLDKFECSSLAAKFGKILQKCEAWQESEA